MKLLVNKDYGGFHLAEAAKGFFVAKGYNDNQVWDLMFGNCPRDLPILHEAFEKFGNDTYSTIEVKEMPDSPYYIDNYDGKEFVITNQDMTYPNATFPEPAKDNQKGGAK